MVDTPPSRVRDAQRVELVRGATLSATEPVTLLLNKPPGLKTGDATERIVLSRALLLATNRARRLRNGSTGVDARLRNGPVQPARAACETG
jgi:16S rRNA U516 pseudouridylate synthase RsuA-like enzyme